MRLPTRTDRPWMPDYGVVRDREGLLPWSWAVDHLVTARRFWVATTNRLGAAHLSAVWAVWLDDALWFSCGARSGKARNLLAEGRCAVATERADEAVTVTGHATRVEDAVVVATVAAAYVAKYGEGFPDPESSPLFALSPEVVIGIIENEPDFSTRATRWTFAPTPLG